MRHAAVIAAWIAVLALLVWQSHGRNIDSLLWGTAFISLVAGAAIGRWWAIALPTAAALVTFLVAYLVVPDCHNCEFGRVGGVALLLFLGVPISTATMTAGVLAALITRWLSAGDQDT